MNSQCFAQETWTLFRASNIVAYNGKDRVAGHYFPLNGCDDAMNDVEITTADMEELLLFQPLFADAQFEPVLEWNPWPVYTAEVMAFFRLAGSPCWADYNYLSSTASKKIDDDAFVAAASLADIRAMLMFCVRSERFGDGNWAYFLKSGRIVAVLQRIAVINDERHMSSGEKEK